MSFNVDFYNFSKRKNSTKQPSGTHTTLVCELNDNFNLIDGDIVVNTGRTQSAKIYTYCYIAEFDRYYFVTNWTYQNGLWYVTLTVDVLATYKANILATSAFILYAQTAFNSHIVDTRLQQVSIASNHISSGNNRFFDLDGWYDQIILFFVSEATNLSSAGAVQAYAVDRSQLKDVSQSLYSAGTTVWQDLLAQAGSAKDCITKCITVPYDIPSASSTEIILGNYHTGVNGKPVLGRTLLPSCDISIPWQTSDYRRFYHKFSLILPFVGAVSIAASDIVSDSRLSVNAQIDILTGDLIYYVCHDSEALMPFATFKTNCATVTPVSSYQSNTVGAITSLGSGAISAAAGNAMGAISSVANAAADFCLSKTVSCAGNQGGCCEAFDRPTLVCTYNPTAVEPSSVSSSIGRPYFAQNSLSGFTGRIQTSGFSVDASCTDSERTMINSLVDSGIFIE